MTTPGTGSCRQPLATGPWLMWAHRAIREDVIYYHHAGKRRWVELFHLSDPIVPVLITQSPEGTYLGWMDTEREWQCPCMIWSSPLLFEVCFAGGSKQAIQALQERGHEAKVLRLTVTELDIQDPEGQTAQRDVA